MKIAVTGGTGFLGRYLIDHLLAQGHTCRCWYRPDSVRGARAVMAEGRPVEWIPGRLGDDQSAAALVAGCDAVVHAALDRPGPGFRGAEGDIVQYAERNLVGTLQLIAAARAARAARFVFVSTCAVHERVLDDRPLDETHPAWPQSHYGAHKAALEMFVHSFGWAEQFPICALRPCGIYGLAEPIEASKWYPLVAKVVRGESVHCQRGGKEVHAMDVARAAELLLHAEGIAGECFNCCDRYVSEYEVATMASQMAGTDAPIEGFPTTSRHQIITDKLRALGLEFGGMERLRDTVEQLVLQARRAEPSVERPPVGIIIVDHGSRRDESNQLLLQVARQFQQAHGWSIVEPAHMELAEPSLGTAFDRAVEQGARLVIVHPYFLGPGNHWWQDIPQLAAAAAARHAGVRFCVTEPLGLHPRMPEVIQDRVLQSLRELHDAGGPQ